MKIKTEFINPPIPDCSNDWVAWDEDDPEFGCGHGKTEKEAIEDFKNLLEMEEEGSLKVKTL